MAEAGNVLVRAHETPRVRVATAPNPSPKTLDGTRLYLVGDAPAYLIDPGPHLPTFLDAVVRDLRATGTDVRGVLLTHGHPDHAPGARHIADALNIPIHASPLIGTGPFPVTVESTPLRFPESFPIAHDTIEAIPSPGHSPDHVAYWLPRSRMLFAGDTILGQGTSLVQPPEGDMVAYMETLRTLLALRPSVIFPGHGPVVLDAENTIRAYIAHRLHRETQVLDVLATAPASAEDLVNLLYADTPVANRSLALGSLEGTLDKLLRERRVSRRGELYARER